MEIRPEQGVSHAIKVIESLKKHLFDTTESGRYNNLYCASIYP